MFMAVHSRYGHHHLKDILCSTDSWRGRGSEEFTLPHLLQDTGELVHIDKGEVVFSYLSKNGQEPNLGSRWQEICDDPELCEEWQWCPAKCGTWSHGLQSMLDEGAHNLVPAEEGQLGSP